MLSKAVFELIYEAASMQRWNDHIRPHKGFTELDKQAHKMNYAYILAKYEEEEAGHRIDWTSLIEESIFQFFRRVILTDIKPPIYYRMMEKQGEAVNRWVLEEMGKRCGEKVLCSKMEDYLFSREMTPEKKIVRAAHYFATSWEFKFIYGLNKDLYGIEGTRERIKSELEQYSELRGVQKLALHNRTEHFLDMIGQLRFQMRWAQSARIPETSVLGHAFVVALFSYVLSLDRGFSEKRLYNNFFGGLFHDLPEVMTRDIVSPVKKSAEGLDSLIKEIEKEMVEETLLPLLPEYLHEEIRFFTEDEFKDKIILDGEVRCLAEIEEGKVLYSGEERLDEYDEEKYCPKDGAFLKVCDILAAYIEAYLSLSHGVSSRHLREGHRKMYEEYKGITVNGIEFGPIFDYFKAE